METILGLATFLGVLSHVFLFIHGEWHLRGPAILQLSVSGYLASITILTVFYELPLQYAVVCATKTVAAYELGLFASIAVYRLFFHPLQAFPGPKMASVTKFWHCWQCRTSKNYLVLDSLRGKYGNFVRTGPNELTVFDPAIMSAAASNRVQAFGKPDWYDFLQPFKGLNVLRDNKEHDVRRRLWDHGFTTKALQEYEKRVYIYGQQFDEQIAAHVGQPMEMRNWFYFLTFDIMGDLTFGKSFDMLKNATWNEGPKVIRRGLGVLSWATPVPWLAHLAFQFPVIPVIVDWRNLISYCRNVMQERLDSKGAHIDISAALIQASIDAGTLEQDKEYLFGDSITLIIAGSDTVAATLNYLFYCLCTHPEAKERLVQEIRSVEDVTDSKILKDLPYLNACISETLRLYPAVPTGGLRQVPDGGVTVNGHFIPGGTILCIPAYSIHRGAESFERASEFIPERWYDQSKLAMNKQAYAPFSVGRFNCVGKHLGLAELRYIVSLVLSKYDFQPANSEHLSKVITNTRDTFTALPGSFELVFEKT